MKKNHSFVGGVGTNLESLGVSEVVVWRRDGQAPHGNGGAAAHHAVPKRRHRRDRPHRIQLLCGGGHRAHRSFHLFSWQKLSSENESGMGMYHNSTDVCIYFLMTLMTDRRFPGGRMRSRGAVLFSGGGGAVMLLGDTGGVVVDGVDGGRHC